jgi:hypothetical protein
MNEETLEEMIDRIKREVDSLSPNAPDFTLKWANMVELVNYTAVSYVPTNSRISATLECPNCQAKLTLTLK